MHVFREKKVKNLKKIKLLKNFENFLIFNEFPEFRINRKIQKSAQKTASLKWHAFQEKSRKIKKNKIFEKF